jgi:ribosomal protein S18 acetylase RimI-like enzyme
VGHIEDVSVGKGYQRKGIGFKLVNYATEQAALMGIKTVVQMKVCLSTKSLVIHIRIIV